jgi:hypothetical protein
VWVVLEGQAAPALALSSWRVRSLLLLFCYVGAIPEDSIQQLTTNMRQVQTPALLSLDLHRKSVVPDVPIVDDVPEIIVLPEVW